MSALNNQTNRNSNRYFFATAEGGEQTLSLEYGTTGGTPNLSTMAVAISGGAGNAVVVNYAPAYGATEYILGEQALIAGTASSYFTVSTLTATAVGVNISTDRIPGTGTACIESYSGNGSLRGFEFLSRGVDSQLISTPMDGYLSSIGRPGATAVLGGTGTMAVNTLINTAQSYWIDQSGNANATIPTFPAPKSNVEFGASPSKVAILAGATSNQTLFGSTWAPLFSTPMTNLNPNGQTFLSINWENSLSTSSNHVNFKVGFSTATAYTNVVNTSFVPGTGGTWSPSDIPGATTPIGYTLTTCCLDNDGVNADGSGMLYVLGQFSDPGAAADQIYITKGSVSEPTRNALVWRAF